MTKIKDVEPQYVLSEIKMDSLEKLSMAMDLEETFNIEISDEDIEEFETVSDVITYLQSAVKSPELQWAISAIICSRMRFQRGKADIVWAGICNICKKGI